MLIRIMGVLIFLITVSCFLVFGSARAASPSDVLINEVAWMGTVVSYNDEWIELYNKSDSPINLDGWILEATDGTPKIKLMGNVPVNGFYLLERSKDYTGALENGGEILELYDNFGNLIDSVDASSGWPTGNNETKQTMERKGPSWQTSLAAGGTPKAENSKVAGVGSPLVSSEDRPPRLPENGSPTDSPTTTPPVIAEESYEVQPRKIEYPSGVFINEILPSPTGPDEKEEWVEIFNENNFEVNISDWQITDTAGNIKVYVFPEGSIINPGEFLVLFRPTTKITLNNQGDGLKFSHPDGNVINEIGYDNAPRGESYSRFKSGWAWTSTPTPGSTNTPPVSTPAPERETIEDKPSQTELAAIGEQAPKSSNALLLFLAAVFTSLFSGVIILVLKHVRAQSR